MNRVIKFRAWDKDSKSMFQGCGVKGIFFNYETGDLEGVNVRDMRGSFTLKNDHFVLMQFTGLLDKNGKEIYEGDVIKSGFTGMVYWEGAGFYIQFFNQETGDYLYNSIGFFRNNIDPKELTVIGNIYENPDLLKGNK